MGCEAVHWSWVPSNKCTSHSDCPYFLVVKIQLLIFVSQYIYIYIPKVYIYITVYVETIWDYHISLQISKIPTWWLIPVSKWVITAVITGLNLTLFTLLTTGITNHLLTEKSHLNQIRSAIWEWFPKSQLSYMGFGQMGYYDSPNNQVPSKYLQI